ncbi:MULTISPECIES: FAD-dependent oxidoreductase [Alphaproteobacteria]|uniref:2-polyprenyl-6-methoxyphenol hydroxylase n=3 Tax=Paracoccus TaxID=265 RepID=A0A238YNT4_9RHOB|nr:MULTISPECIES: FAD-dependent oxidoreductase [Paracoccus]MDP5305637.1 FAD-dependent oxidoreductase [Paracoccus sp. 2205BS29-5]SNR72805.1 2-polyprenyl-6-methoxyphenol hydroxylase [Paracoccus sediminis]
MRYLYSNLERSQSCVVVGAGPAGLMLGLLLARSGVDVTVIEKHQDFLRDFRGDTIHPSTLEAMHELGYLDELLTLPHQKAYQLHAEIEGRKVTIADFSKLPTRAKFIAFMPQWDFLNFLARKAAGFPRFRLLMSTEITSLRWEAGRVVGVNARQSDRNLVLDADLVIGADGRNSATRKAAGLEFQSFGTATDILWMKVSKKAGDPQQAMSHAGPRQGLVLIDRGDYWQCGYVITKGTVDALKDGGIGALRARIAEVAPLPADRFKEIRSWDDVHLLSVRIDRLKTWWKPGLLFIGDAAHAMSLIGGVGVNLAIQDAIATANLLAEALREGRMKTRLLEAVQRRRAFPTRATQKLQLMMRSRKRAGEADSARSPKPPLFMRLIARSPLLPRLTGRLIGLGFRPEHVRTQLVDWSCSLRKSAAPPR